MKKIIIALTIALLLIISLISCGGNNNDNNNNDKDSTGTQENEGMITETGTDTNIIDNVESMFDTVESDIMETR